MKRSKAITLLLTGFAASCSSPKEEGLIIFKDRAECEKSYSPTECDSLLSSGKTLYRSNRDCREWSGAECDHVSHGHLGGGTRFYSYRAPSVPSGDVETVFGADPSRLSGRNFNSSHVITTPVRRGGFGSTGFRFFGGLRGG